MHSDMARGITSSLTASVIFALLFPIVGTIDGLSVNEVTGLRIGMLTVTVALLLCVCRQQHLMVDAVVRVAKHPALLLVLAATTIIIGLQSWLFMWGPLGGAELEVALGYLLLPLVMVLVGRIMFGDQIARWKLAAVLTASAGVAAFTITGGAVAIETVAVATTYPIYFALRRQFAMDNLGYFWLEMMLLFPLAFVWSGSSTVARTLAASPQLVAAVAAMGLLSTLAMGCYIAASRLLPLSTFGLLGYVEPIGLVAVSLAMGAALTAHDIVLYGPICIGLVFLAVSFTRYGEKHITVTTTTPQVAVVNS